MRVPVWLTLGVACLVCVFGLYRIRIAFRSDEEDQRARARKGLYAMGRRTHFLIGVIYLLLGGALAATSFGWSPLGGLFAPPDSGAPAAPGGAKNGTKVIQLGPAPTLPPPTAAPSESPAPAPTAPAATAPAPAPGNDSAPKKDPPVDRNAPPPSEER